LPDQAVVGRDGRGRDVAGPEAEARRNEMPIPLFPPSRTSPWGSVVT
jgi:hypothetical protein